MAADDLPVEYDDIVIGTGVQESILAAALARIGHRVLHLDRNDYYSGEWATFNLKSLLDWIQKNQSTDHTAAHRSIANDASASETVSLQVGERLVFLPSGAQTVSNIEASIHVKEKADDIPSLDPSPLPARTEENGESSEVLSHSDASGIEASQEENQSTDENGEPSRVVPSSKSTRTEGQQDDTLAAETCQTGEQPPPSEGANGPEGHSSDNQTSDLQSSTGSAATGQDESDSGETASGHQHEGDNAAATSNQGGQESIGQGDVQASADEGSIANQVPVSAASGRREWTWEGISKEWRRFNIDLAPKLMFCRGSMVELLVSSRISRYAEFKAVTRILTHINGKLEQVPCSRADVFSSRYVSVLEKRMLMRLIEFCLDHENREDDYRDYVDKPFTDFLKSRKLTTTLQHFVVHSIAMVPADTPTQQALQAMQYFLRSLGRYGNTAFLWTLYGSGELPQCFCRMCAVFAGIYILRTGIMNMIVDPENNVKGIIDTEGRRLSCRNLIMEHSYAPPQASSLTPSYISRGILITDKSMKSADLDQITLLTIPPRESGKQPVRVIEVGYAACVAPKDLYVVHLTCKASIPEVMAKDALQPVIDQFFQMATPGDEADGQVDERPRILWSLFFTQQDVSEISDDTLREGLPSNVFVTSGPGSSIGFEHAVSQAKRLFERLCPGEEFLPAAPEPDDLIFEDPSQDNPGEHPQAGFERDAEKTENKDAASPGDEDERTETKVLGEESSIKETNETLISENSESTSDQTDELAANQGSDNTEQGKTDQSELQ